MSDEELILVGIVSYIFFPLILSGGITGIIAFAKGRSFLAWFVYGFFFPLFSQLHAIFCERKKRERPPNQSISESLPPAMEKSSLRLEQRAPVSSDPKNKEVPSEATTTQFDPLSKHTPPSSREQGTFWLPIPAFVLGIFTCGALLDESPWDFELIAHQLFFSAGALALGIHSIHTQKKGKKMAIAGIVLGAIAILGGVSEVFKLLG